MAAALPLWIAPTVLSLLSLLVLCVGVVDIIATQTAPELEEFTYQYSFRFYAMCVLGYVFLDGVAGGLATARSGPATILYAITRNCANGISTSLLVLCSIMSLQLTSLSFFWVVAMTALVTLYLAQWQEYVTGNTIPIKFNRADFHFIAVTVPIITGFSGTSIWHIELLGGWLVNDVVALVMLGQAAGLMLKYWEKIMEGGPGECGTTPANTGVLSPCIPVLLVLLSGYQLLRTDLYEQTPYPAMIGVSLLLSKVQMKLSVAHMTKSPMTKTDTIFFPILAMYLDSWVGIGQLANWLLGMGIDELRFVYIADIFFVFSCVNYGAKCALEVSQASSVSIFGHTPAPTKKVEQKKNE